MSASLRQILAAAWEEVVKNNNRSPEEIWVNGNEAEKVAIVKAVLEGRHRYGTVGGIDRATFSWWRNQNGEQE